MRYATQDTEDLRFEKSYKDLCEFLGIKPFPYLSQIRQQLEPSLDELKKHGYISKWQIEPTADKQDYKIIFYHGKKFHQDHALRKEQKAQVQPPRSKSVAAPKRPATSPPTALPADLLAALIDFGFSQDVAEEILSQHPAAEICRQLAAYPFHARQKNIDNPQGFLRRAIQYGWRPPRAARAGQGIDDGPAPPAEEKDPLADLTNETRLFEDEADAHRRWQAALQSIEPTLDPHTFDTWLRALQALGFNYGALVLGCPNDYFVTWVTEHFLDLIQQALGCSVQLIVNSRF